MGFPGGKLVFSSFWLLRRLILTLAFLAAWFACSVIAAAGTERVALVIGNAKYDHVANLPNAGNDAADLADALARIGFKVWESQNLDYRGMRLALRDFSRDARDAEMAVIYFAGHGIEIDNNNFLIPVNSELRSDQDVEFEAIRLDAVISSISTAKGLKLVLIDACRNNPFLGSMQREAGTRSIGRGLGQIDPSGVLVSYAAKGGTLALDGEGRNSPYATALLRHIEEPGLELGKMFRKVRDTVYQLTDGYQEPFTYGSLPSEDIFLVPTAAEVRPDQSVSESLSSQIYSDFELARSVATLEAIDAFLKRYENQKEHFAVALALSMRDDLSAKVQPKTFSDDDGNSQEIALVPPPTEKDNAEQTRSLIRDIQTELNRVGCSAGAADGVAGPRTRSAFSRYRSARKNLGLRADGWETQETLSALRKENGRVCAEVPTAVPRTFDGDYVISIRRRWDDDYWQTTNRPDSAYYPGKVEPLASMRINRNGNRLTLVSAQAFTGGGPWFKDFKGSFDDDGQLNLRFTLSSHFGPPVTPYKVRIDVKLPQGLEPGRRLVYEPRRIDGQFFLNFLIRRAN